MKEDFTIAHDIATAAVDELVERQLIRQEAHLVTSSRVGVIQAAILKGLADEGYVRLVPVKPAGD